MALFDKICRRSGGNWRYREGRKTYLGAVEALMAPENFWELPSMADLEASLEMVAPPETLTPFQVGQLKEAMRAELADRLRMKAEYEGRAP